MRAKLSAFLFPLLLATGCSRPLAPDAFLAKAIQGDNSEMTLGAIAASKGGSAVADYGRALVADHTKARSKATAIAAHYGLTPPSDLLPEASKERTKLQGLSGAAFDKEFVSYMIDDHKGDISDFTKEAKSDAPSDVKALARDALPDLQKHLDMAKRLT
ncbi:DUF4142 domain-containing protein [Sphingomonas sp. PL20]|jgi:putative membrane protein|uniref:DUF4142 domain-containing protein n=1 Tax=Sphingomonas sp. PL20 TaxID=2760712 RepID=UPI001AE2411A